jgi:large subunit ribosomal protein L32e
MTKETVLKEFEALKGVGKVKAKLLYDSGYDSLEKLKKAKIKDLTKLTKKTDEKKEQEEPTEKKAEAVEIVDKKEGTYQPKIKPQLNEKEQEQLVIRRQIKKRTPHFLRDEGFRYKRIPKNWRRPTGYTSKLRINLKYRPSKVRVGFRAPKLVRGLHASGFEEVMVHTVKELETIDPKKQAVRIGGTVGTKKRLEIAKRADELTIRVLNMRG